MLPAELMAASRGPDPGRRPGRRNVARPIDADCLRHEMPSTGMSAQRSNTGVRIGRDAIAHWADADDAHPRVFGGATVNVVPLDESLEHCVGLMPGGQGERRHCGRIVPGLGIEPHAECQGTLTAVGGQGLVARAHRCHALGGHTLQRGVQPIERGQRRRRRRLPRAILAGHPGQSSSAEFCAVYRPASARAHAIIARPGGAIQAFCER